MGAITMQEAVERARDSRAAIEWLDRLMAQQWGPYKARWARKRTPRYLTKGGVRK